jgi:hypothetical protein
MEDFMEVLDILIMVMVMDILIMVMVLDTLDYIIENN